MGAEGEPPKFIRKNYMGRRKLWFIVSGSLIVVYMATFAVQGLNLGIDFRGGTQVTFATEEPVSLEEVRANAAAIGQEGATVVGRGEQVGAGRYQEFVIRTETLAPAEQARLTSEIERSYGAEPNVRSVSGSFGRQIAEGALLAIFFSLILIVIYISARFEWRYSVPVIVALLHDIVLTVGLYALLAREVSTATVAAVLTVLGYSIYDTIIIFDRIRENIPLMKRSSFNVIGNVSLWEMIPRSLATTFSTLLPVGALYFFGGETLKDFAFALLVGIGAGAYSSIFIAAPLLGWLKEREPEWQRRKDESSLEGVTSVGMLLRAREAAAAQPAPELVPVAAPGDLDEPSEDTAGDGDGDADVAATPVAAPRVDEARLERRRQRRKSRPHGRSR